MLSASALLQRALTFFFHSFLWRRFCKTDRNRPRSLTPSLVPTALPTFALAPHHPGPAPIDRRSPYSQFPLNIRRTYTESRFFLNQPSARRRLKLPCAAPTLTCEHEHVFCEYLLRTGSKPASCMKLLKPKKLFPGFPQFEMRPALIFPSPFSALSILDLKIEMTLAKVKSLRGGYSCWAREWTSKFSLKFYLETIRESFTIASILKLSCASDDL